MDNVAIISDAGEELFPVNARLLGVVAGLHALDSQGLMVFIEELRLAWGVWEEEEDDGGKEDCGRSFDCKGVSR